ncbi:MAG: response regulator transcription factor [Acidimicrobiia bacterium]
MADEPESVEHGYVACSEAEQALARSRTDEAEALAERGIRIGQRFEAPGLVALAICWQGLARLTSGDVESGAALLDEAMCSVMAGELDHHFTGWVYCFAIGMCMGVADLGRAAAWTEAAQAWCTSLPEATPYHGLCRVRQVEVMSLRGDLERAETEARRACEEMLAFEPHLAGEAFYVAGEVLRRKGEPEAAEEAFARARELGHDPQPGLALLRRDQGRVDTAASSLRAALADPGRPPFQRAMLLGAQVEVRLRGGDLESAAAACEELVTVARELPSGALSATAATARGQLLLAEDHATEALAELRRAAARWRELGLRWEAATVRVLISQAMQQLGDREGAELEREAARSELAGLGSQHAQRVEEMTIDRRQPPRGLTERERDVLRLVAAGWTNRQIAQELILSEHTIARHVSNIFTKLGVSSRTAAAAFAFEHGLT